MRRNGSGDSTVVGGPSFSQGPRCRHYDASNHDPFVEANPTPRELARLAVQKARAHVEAAKLLSAAGHNDFATFHLLTATEEVLKSRLVGEAAYQILMASEPSNPPISMRAMNKGLFSHPFKIPAGLLLLMLQTGVLAAIKHPNFDSGMTQEEVESVKAKSLADAQWIAENLSDGSEIREQAIYSGVDHSGKMPRAVDWRAVVERLAPILDDQIEFATYVAEQPVPPEDVVAGKAQITDWLKKLDQPSSQD